MPRTIAIGDIHGCSAALESLLVAIGPQADDLIVALGDYVDRGPDSRGVIDRLLALRDECELVTLMGNHEALMLAAIDRPFDDNLQFWLDCGGRETLASYGGVLEDIPGEHEGFLRSLQLYHETENHFFVHANYIEDFDLEDQPTHRLLWEHLSYDIPPPHESGRVAVVGHTPQTSGKILDLGHIVCIDTACVMGGRLTAYDVDSTAIWQTDRDGNLCESP